MLAACGTPPTLILDADWAEFGGTILIALHPPPLFLYIERIVTTSMIPPDNSHNPNALPTTMKMMDFIDIIESEWSSQRPLTSSIFERQERQSVDSGPTHVPQD
jgi:hypothetical protein